MDLPVNASMRILEAFCAHNPNDSSTNEIVRMVYETTGSKDRPGIIKTLKIIKKARILESRRVGKQKVEHKLSTLGAEIIDLMNCIKMVNSSFFDIQNLFNKYNELDNKYNNGKITEVQLKLELSELGLTLSDLKKLSDVRLTIGSISRIYFRNICNLLLYRFKSIASDYHLNDICERILIRIVTDELRHQIQIIKEVSPEIKEYKDLYDSTLPRHSIFEPKNEVLLILSQPIFDELQETFAYHYPQKDSSLTNNTTRLIKSLIQLMKPGKNILKSNAGKCETYLNIGLRKIKYHELERKQIDEKNMLKLAEMYTDLSKETQTANQSASR